MPNLNADRMTSGATQANHTGLNIGIASIGVGETGSGSLSISLMPLPAGARVVDVTYLQDTSDGWGTGGEVVTVYATIAGNTAATYISSASQSNVVRPNRDGLGDRLTGSANLMLHIGNLVGTGTASQNIQVICQYMAQDDGD